MTEKPKLLFVFDHPKEELWKDGLWAALELLKTDFDVTKVNLATHPPEELPADFILGWGGFNSKVDNLLQNLDTDLPKGLCIGGNAFPPSNADKYQALFYETEWYRNQPVNAAIRLHPNAVHAFGVNHVLYTPHKEKVKIWDWLTVGSFARWKRQLKLIEKDGTKFAVGEIQQGNMGESLDIITNLLIKGVGISDMVDPRILAIIYNSSRQVYIPADINGGGERAVLEARACEIPVTVEEDNPKLQELLTSPIWDATYYAEQLKKGIMKCLTEN